MLRLSIFAATVLVAGCQSSKPPLVPRAVDDRPLRIKIAHAEARRAGGLAELAELAAGNDPHARALALRGLGRIGGAKALEVIEAAFGDPDPKVAAAAFAAIGLLGSLDDKLVWKPGPSLERALQSPQLTVRTAAVESLGRAGGVDTQRALGACLAQPDLAAACALALGRHGRRKISLGPDAQRALVSSTASSDPAVRYASTYALARVHEPTPDPLVATALARVVTDELPEIRAIAIAGLAKRKALEDVATRKAVEDSLRDRDWRVAVEAVRALAGVDDAGRALVATSLQRRWGELVKGNAMEAHIIIEALRALAGKPLADRASLDAVAALAHIAKTDSVVPAITRGWIECLARLAVPPALTGQIVESITSCGLPDHLRLPLLAGIVTDGIGDASVRRAAFRVLLAHGDPRVRAAGLGALASTWKDTDARGQQTMVTTVTAAIASKEAIVASAGIDAADSVYEAAGIDNPHRAALDSAIATRAAVEIDPDLTSSLYGVIGKRAIAAGADACRAGLLGHLVRMKAAVECLRKLGDAVPMPEGQQAEPPPHDVADVIGKTIVWQLTTSRGVIEIELRPDVAPWAVASIVALTRRGFYNGLELHRVVPNFVVQGGDPTQSGFGGPGFMLPAEPSSADDGAGFMAGGVGMADGGPDSAGSQWFVTHARTPHLDGRYTWFGSVVSGQKSADALLIGDRVERADVLLK